MSVFSDVNVCVNGNPDILKLMSTLNSHCLRSKSILYIAIFSVIFILVMLCKIATTTFRHGDFNKKSRTLGVTMWRLIMPPPMHYMHKFIRFRRCANLKTYAAISNAHISRVCKRGKLSGSCLSTLNGFGSTQLPIFLCHIGVPTFSSQNN